MHNCSCPSRFAICPLSARQSTSLVGFQFQNQKSTLAKEASQQERKNKKKEWKNYAFNSRRQNCTNGSKVSLRQEKPVRTSCLHFCSSALVDWSSFSSSVFRRRNAAPDSNSPAAVLPLSLLCTELFMRWRMSAALPLELPVFTFLSAASDSLAWNAIGVTFDFYMRK